MFVGHYSVSFAAKKAEKRIPLWLLFLAVQWIDVMWSIFVLLGIEKVRIVPGITASKRSRSLLHAVYAQPVGRAVLVGAGVCGPPYDSKSAGRANRNDPCCRSLFPLDSRPDPHRPDLTLL